MSKRDKLMQKIFKGNSDISPSEAVKIPEPLNIKDFKGSITYRTSKERHYRLAKQAKLSGKSINAFIDEAISEKLKMRNEQ